MDDVEGLKKQLVPTVLLYKTLDMSAPEIWRLVMCDRDFHKTFLNFKGCTNIDLGPWSLLTGIEHMPAASKWSTANGSQQQCRCAHYLAI